MDARPDLTPADHDFARFVDAVAAQLELTRAEVVRAKLDGARPALSYEDHAFAVFVEQGRFALEMMAIMAAQASAVTQESARAFRHGMHQSVLPVPKHWQERRPLGNRWQRAAAKLAWQINAPLEQVTVNRPGSAHA